MVERVVGFETKLNARSLLANLDALEQAHVPLLEAGAPQTAVPGIQAHAAFGSRREAGRVDERVDVPRIARQVRVAAQDHAGRHMLASGDLPVQRRRASARDAAGDVDVRSRYDA